MDLWVLLERTVWIATAILIPIIAYGCKHFNNKLKLLKASINKDLEQKLALFSKDMNSLAGSLDRLESNISKEDSATEKSLDRTRESINKLKDAIESLKERTRDNEESINIINSRKK